MWLTSAGQFPRRLVVTTGYDARNFSTTLCLLLSFSAAITTAFLHYTFHKKTIYK